MNTPTPNTKTVTIPTQDLVKLKLGAEAAEKIVSQKGVDADASAPVKPTL